jgi:hypothetical protein
LLPYLLLYRTATVGASHSGGDDLQAGMFGPDYLWVDSRVGPTYGDGRVKPDIVAPGYTVMTARAKPGYGECDPSQRLLPPSGALDGLAYRHGTSFAAPVVSGAAAMVTQYFQDGFYPTGSKTSGDAYPDPSGALVKAVLLNGAQPLMGVHDSNTMMNSGNHGYDAQQGLGRLNLGEALPLNTNPNNKFNAIVQDRARISSGVIKKMRIKIDTSQCTATDLSVTLVWMDPPGGAGCQNCYVNNLDLRVVQRNNNGIIISTKYGNDIYGQNISDARNNVERVRWNNPSSHNTMFFEVEVQATNLATSTQEYALVITGCVEYLSSQQQICPCPQGRYCNYSC